MFFCLHSVTTHFKPHVLHVTRHLISKCRKRYFRLLFIHCFLMILTQNKFEILQCENIMLKHNMSQPNRSIFLKMKYRIVWFFLIGLYWN